jgi:chorismate dehydratase
VATIPDLKEYHIVSDFCIGTEGEAVTVCLFSDVSLAEIKKIYLDYQSRTSVELLKWIIKESWDINPEIVDAKDEGYLKEIKGTTAGLVIGDRAFSQRKLSAYCYDLGSEWKKNTGLPFVFAAWVSNKSLSEDFINAFNKANAVGLEHLDEIISELSFNLYDLKKYYSKDISYLLDPGKRKGLEKFLEIIQHKIKL